MRTAVEPSGSVVPRSGPPVTARRRGPLVSRLGIGAGRSVSVGACLVATTAAPPGERRSLRTIRVPYRSRRSTPTVASTNIHSKTRYPRRSRVTASSLTRRSPVLVVVRACPEQDARAADGQRVAVNERRRRHLVALDVGAVGRPEVGRDHALGRDPDLEVTA